MCKGWQMFDVISKFRRFLVEDTSGAVGAEWTVLTAMLVIGL